MNTTMKEFEEVKELVKLLTSKSVLVLVPEPAQSEVRQGKPWIGPVIVTTPESDIGFEFKKYPQADNPHYEMRKVSLAQGS